MMNLNKYKISVIISGGQTGADRGGLDFAIQSKIKHCGWCPLGRKSEDLKIPPKYTLKETSTSLYPARTRMNIRDSDATIIFSADINSKGSLLTTKFCIQMRKPYFIFILDKNNPKLITNHDLKTNCQNLIKWLNKIKPKIINIAGTRESHCKGITEKVSEILMLVFEKSNEEIVWPPKKSYTPNLF